MGLSRLESVLRYLIEPGMNNSARHTYELLLSLTRTTPDKEMDTLIAEVNKIDYHSNTNSYFHFYLPIISHILFYKPHFENELLPYLIGPHFANGVLGTTEMITAIQEATVYKLSQNNEHVSAEGKEWVFKKLPDLEMQIEREIQKCRAELNG